MSEVSITYCKPCGYLRRAEDAAAELQKQLGVAATLVPGKGGVSRSRSAARSSQGSASGISPTARKSSKLLRAP